MSDVSWMADKKNKLRRMMEHARTRVSGERLVIVTLTSYPPRMNTIWMTLRSIFSQSRLPDKVVLYLAKSDFPNREADLPDSLKEMLWNDFEIRWVDEDLKPLRSTTGRFVIFQTILLSPSMTTLFTAGI